MTPYHPTHGRTHVRGVLDDGATLYRAGASVEERAARCFDVAAVEVVMVGVCGGIEV